MRFLIVLSFVLAVPLQAQTVMELGYDNGTPYDVLDNNNDIEGEAIRFTPPAPCRILSVRFFPDSSGQMEIHIWKDDGGHKPDRFAPDNDLMPPIVVSAQGGVWNEVTLTTPVTIDPPRPFYVGQFDMENNSPHVYLDNGLPARSVARNNLYGREMDPLHSNQRRWRVLGDLDLSGEDRMHYFMIRATIETFNEVAEHRFEEVASDVGFYPWSSHLAWGDYDRDGFEDILLAGRTMLRNNGPPDWTFTNVTGAIGIGGPYIGGLFADYDNDGDLDFYSIANQGNNDAMWRNDGPPDYGFTNVTSSVGNPTDDNPTQACGWGDYDLDGYVDLYVVGSESGSTYYEDYLYRNTGPPNFVFQDVSNAAGIRSGSDRNGRSVAWSDYNQDDWPDIYVGNYRLHRNFLLENQGDGTFDNVAGDKDVDGQSPDPGRYGHTSGAVWGDVNNDGNLDLLVANLAHSNWLDWSDTTKLYLNSGHPNYDFSDILGLTDTNRLSSAGVYFNETQIDPSLIDYDGDGFLDIFISAVYAGWESDLYRNTGNPGNPQFVIDNYPSGLVVDNGYGSGWSDYDHDGDLELAAGSAVNIVGGFFLNNSNTPAKTDIPNWLEVRLEGVQANAAAIGAVITLHYPGGVQTREVTSGRGAASGDSFTQYFGLGPHATVDRLEIRWPGGCALQTYYPWFLNEIVTIVEDCSPVERCDNVADDDGDSDIDCADTDCIGHPACPESDHCSDGVDNDGDGDSDCDDIECGGTEICPGVAVNRSVVAGPAGASPPVATAFDPSCRVGLWRLCPEEHHTVFVDELRLQDEAVAGAPGRLSFYEHSTPVVMSVATDGADLILSWLPDLPACPAESECSAGEGCVTTTECFFPDTGDQSCLKADQSVFGCPGGETVHIRRCFCSGALCALNDNHLVCRP